MERDSRDTLHFTDRFKHFLYSKLFKQLFSEFLIIHSLCKKVNANEEIKCIVPFSQHSVKQAKKNNNKPIPGFWNYLVSLLRLVIMFQVVWAEVY